jgi:putative methyltransferase (TIGR04325 family)
VSCVERLGRVPGLRRILRARHERLARTSDRWLFYGVFSSYEDALAGQPRRSDLPDGYQSRGVARLGEEGYATMRAFDYPVVYWLGEELGALGLTDPQTAVRVVDLGGHLGEKRKVWAGYVPEVEGTPWTVCETEDAVQEARGRGLDGGHLRFSSDPQVVDGAHLLIASGSLQYLPYAVTELLAGVDRPPPTLLFNKVPLSPGPSFWTLQNLGHTSVPYRVFNDGDFLGALAGLGYELLDRWTVPGLYARVPFRPELGTEVNSGIFLRRRG